ncbi:AAA family ATPase [Patulibacter defluvii]|uniref:AAA family ATPase n=1 Tax=Patulibacter defluvii TaxID=3095358 RepID=UPI002A74DDA4|nr:AAA family ATPase [Patulibacter sp. DM4]
MRDTPLQERPTAATAARRDPAAPHPLSLRTPARIGPALLVERGVEVGALVRAMAEAAAGNGSCVVVEGPAGRGKTTLLDVLDGRVRQGGWRTARVGGGVADRGSHHGLLRSLIDAAAAAAPDVALPPAIAALASGGPLPPHADAGAVASALHGFARTLAARGPLALIVDDAHHADERSLAALVGLARRAAELRLLVVVAARPAIGPDAADVVGAFAAVPRALVLEPRPLSGDGTAQLLHRWRPDADETLVRRCHEAAGGDPWLLSELCRQLAREGDAVLDAAGDLPALSPPARIVLRRRLAELPAPARAVVHALAVLGGEGDLHDLAAVAGVPLAELAAIGSALATAGLSDGHWRFPHPLVEHAIHDQVPPAERERLHRAAAAALIERNGSERAVADHFLHAGPTCDEDVTATLRRAATAASAEGALARAASYLERALEERAPGDDRAELLTELGTLAFHAGTTDARPHLHEALIATDDPGARIETLRRLAALQVIDPRAESLELVEDAVPADAAPAERLAAEVAQLDALILFPDRSGERARRTLALDPGAVDDDLLRRAVLAHHAWLGAETGDRTACEVAVMAHEALDGGALLEEAAHRAAGHLCIRVLVTAGEHASAARAIAGLRERAAAFGSPRLAAAAGWYAAGLALRRGELGLAEREASRALAAVDGLNGVAAGILELLVETLVERGAVERAAAVLSEHEPLWTADSGWEIGVRHARARLLLATGELEMAEAEAREAGRLRIAQGRPNPAWTAWRTTLALALARQGRFAEAAAVADEEVALARRFGDPHALGRALHARAVSEPDHGRRAERARAALDEVADPGALVRVRLQIAAGDALVRRGSRVTARELLRPAFETADRLGAAPDAAEARRALVASGLRPRTAAVSGVASLTPRQRQICELVAAGRSNRAIAQELYLSIKTVETHLATSYQKLSVSGRQQLAALLDAPADVVDDEIVRALA